MFFSKLRSTNYFSLLFKGVKRASIHMETKFQLRTEEQKLQAIGGYYDSNKKFHLQDQTRIPKSTNIAQLTAALDPSIFAPLPKPGPSDWLANHQEYGQPFSDYVNYPGNKVGDKGRGKIYLCPMAGNEKDLDASFLKSLEKYAQSFFCMPVEMLKVVSDLKYATKRINPYTKNEQYLTRDLMSILRNLLPEDGYCIVGITMHDLYPHPDWNFVFGQAELQKRTGVYSFCRYNPQFWGEEPNETSHQLLLSRSCKVMTHELIHQFGMHHCVYYNCLLNGSNHLEESDSRPMSLCPVCYRKLHYAIGFDIPKREELILNFLLEHKLDSEAKWQKRQLERILHSK